MEKNSKRWLRNLKRRENKIISLLRSGKFMDSARLANSKFFDLIYFFKMMEAIYSKKSSNETNEYFRQFGFLTVNHG